MTSRVHAVGIATAGRLAAMLAATAALAVGIAAGTARGAELYLKGAAGIAQGIESDVSGTNVTGGRVRYDLGGTAAAAVGVRAAPFRVELEGGFAYTPAGELDATSVNTSIGTFVNISNIQAAGHVETYTAMINGYVDIPVGWSQVTPYVGGGAGLAYVRTVDVDGVVGGAHFALSNSDDLVPAAQAEVGLVYTFRPQMALELAYRYFRSLRDARLDDAIGGTFTADLSQHRVMIALRFYL